MDIGLVGEGDEQRPGVRLIVEDPAQGVSLVATEQAWIYERPDARPLVRVDDEWRSYSSQALLLADLADGTLDGRDGPGVVGEVPAPDPGSRAPVITSSTLGDDVVGLEVEASGRALVTVAQAKVDGWSVEVDGESAPLVAVDGALQGVIVEPGTHEVVFRFAPRAFSIARLVSALALAALVATGVWAAIVDRRRRRGRPSEEPAGPADPTDAANPTDPADPADPGDAPVPTVAGP